MIRRPPRSTLFPTRRSSDLALKPNQPTHSSEAPTMVSVRLCGGSASRPKPMRLRSEEHTSELQSQSNLVCRLLLEKKNKALVLSETAVASVKHRQKTAHFAQ